eukprot:TRINITY_DN4077_c1_g1_i2.p2 TRINITY_DN4077_c1_g1~~TRINITY_DN4077_c1_g1_i2.p2  ORF type:complete len:318 (+),score=78.75 TRINITY_DN4077_c1_g1_i2:1135-2088(+)
MGMSALSVEKLFLQGVRLAYDHIKIGGVESQQVIGRGAFGVVYRGMWQGTTPVAIKQVHSNLNVSGLLHEAALLSSLKHPNIVQFLGVSAVDAHISVVTELADGSVLTLIKLEELPAATLVDMAAQTALGMNYLSAHGIVHRDLACRNLLYCATGKGYQVKIADFGLSVVLDKVTDAVPEELRKLSVRWAALETLCYGVCTHKSDVWSFGVVLYELFSGGAVPYDDFEVSQILSRLKQGFRLPPPKGCPPAIAHLMNTCWLASVQERPDFELLCCEFEGLQLGDDCGSRKRPAEEAVVRAPVAPAEQQATKKQKTAT